MTDFLCAVSGSFPENYEIGVRAQVWGVEEKYEDRIRRTAPGDLVVLMVAGEFRSIHRIESEVYRDETLLWPEKDGSVFPCRVRISPPLYKGAVPVESLSMQISFMRGTQKWQGTVQGRNGVFNDRLTAADIALIREALNPYRVPRARPSRVAEGPRVSLQVFERQLQEALSDLLAALGLTEARGPLSQGTEAGAVDQSALTVITRAIKTDAAVVLVLDTGEKSSELILRALREIVRLRQTSPRNADIRGLILTDTLREDLRWATSEIPNLDVRTYRMRFELDPEPEAGNGTNGWNAA